MHGTARDSLVTVGDCRVYVIGLAPEGLVTVGSMGAVYVGETGTTPDERFASHSASSRMAVGVAARRGVRLRPDLTPEAPFESRAEVLRWERRTAKELRNRGYRVFGGHGLPFMKSPSPEGESA